jgi:competence protein ComGF
LEKQQIKTSTPKEQIKQTPIQSETEQKSEPEEKNNPETTTERRKPERGKNHLSKLTSSLIIITILLTITSVGATLMVQQNYSELTNEKLSLENELFITKEQIVNTSSSLNSSRPLLEQINTELQEMISFVNLQKIGDTYYLHDPLLNDVTQFIANDTSSDILLEIDNAKEQGVQCAYVIVQIVSASNGEYELIGFNTADNGMVYFEPKTDYRVFPITGNHYVDCVEGHPYSSTFDDTITSILAIW